MPGPRPQSRDGAEVWTRPETPDGSVPGAAGWSMWASTPGLPGEELGSTNPGAPRPLTPTLLRQTVPFDEDAFGGDSYGLLSIPSPPQTPIAGQKRTMSAAQDGRPGSGGTLVGHTTRTRSVQMARPGSAPPQLSLYHQKRPRSPATVAVRPDSAPSLPPEGALEAVREVGVERPTAPHTFGVVSAVNETTMPPPPPVVDTSRSCCPWVGPRVISGERFKFDLALRRRCCYCEGICEGLLLRRRLVQFSWGWRHYTGAALWRRGEGRAVKTLVLAALIANLVALCATYDQEPEQSGWHLTLPVDGGVWAWVEWGSAVVLVLEVLLQAMAGSFLPWLLDVRHLLRLLLACIVTLSLVHPHVSLRAMRTIVILRVVGMLPVARLEALAESFYGAAGAFVQMSVGLGLLLGLLTLLTMQIFGGAPPAFRPRVHVSAGPFSAVAFAQVFCAGVACPWMWPRRTDGGRCRLKSRGRRQTRRRRSRPRA